MDNIWFTPLLTLLRVKTYFYGSIFVQASNFQNQCSLKVTIITNSLIPAEFVVHRVMRTGSICKLSTLYFFNILPHCVWYELTRWTQVGQVVLQCSHASFVCSGTFTVGSSVTTMMMISPRPIQGLDRLVIKFTVKFERIQYERWTICETELMMCKTSVY